MHPYSGIFGPVSLKIEINVKFANPYLSLYNLKREEDKMESNYERQCEANIVMAVILFLFSGNEIVMFIPGAGIGLLEILSAFPAKSVKEKLVILDKLILFL